MRDWLERRWYASTPPPVWLLPLATLFGRVAARRRQRLQRAATAEALGAPVIVVGNISVGGTGKTPFTLFLLEQLRAWGWSPGVVSRGYGGHAPAYPHHVRPDQDPAAVCGDEPLLLARRGAVPVVVDPDRLRGARALLAGGGVDIVVADDGLQHYRLPRDLEICVVDGQRGLGNGALLPAGPLREPPARLAEVDWLVINGGGWQPPAGLATPLLRMQLVPAEAWPLAGGPPVPLAHWRGQRVHAVAGIGHPQRYFDSLLALGIEVIPHAFPDHHAYVAADLSFGDELPVLMTEKDAVKCTAFAPAQAWRVPVSVQLELSALAPMRQSLEALRRLSP